MVSVDTLFITPTKGGGSEDLREGFILLGGASIYSFSYDLISEYNTSLSLNGNGCSKEFSILLLTVDHIIGSEI